ncbi:MAG: winged helix-turn-helix domain-containing protein [Promethearchaeota archaeon]
MKSFIDLVESLENSFSVVLGVIKALGNKMRFKIMLSLLTGQKSFMDLKFETKLQKTALSNHLTILVRKELIEKPSVGNYKITQDGELFMRAIDDAYQKSQIREKKDIEALQSGKFSKSFIDSFFGVS